jgi:hypothetical protein
VQFSRAAPRGPAPKRGHRPTVKMAGSHPADAGSTPAARSRFHAVVAQRSELEAAKLEMGVRLPLTAPFPTGSGTGVHAAP